MVSVSVVVIVELFLIGALSFSGSAFASDSKQRKTTKTAATLPKTLLPIKAAPVKVPAKVYEPIRCDRPIVTLKPGAISEIPFTRLERCPFSDAYDDAWQVDRNADRSPFLARLTIQDPQDLDPVEIEFKKSPENPNLAKKSHLRARPKRQISCCLKKETGWAPSSEHCGVLALLPDDVVPHQERLLSVCHVELSRLMKESRVLDSEEPGTLSQWAKDHILNKVPARPARASAAADVECLRKAFSTKTSDSLEDSGSQSPSQASRVDGKPREQDRVPTGTTRESDANCTER